MTIWEVATGRQVAALGGQQKWVWSARFSPVEEVIATGGDDGTALLHPRERFMAVQELAREVCTRVTSNISNDEWRRYLQPGWLSEWKRYFGFADYRPTCPGVLVPEFTR